MLGDNEGAGLAIDRLALRDRESLRPKSSLSSPLRVGERLSPEDSDFAAWSDGERLCPVGLRFALLERERPGPEAATLTAAFSVPPGVGECPGSRVSPYFSQSFL